MKITKYILIFLVSLLISNNTSAQNYELCGVDDYNCVNGEVLTYKLYYKFGFITIPTGEVTFLARESEDYYEIEVLGKTYKAYDPIFKVRDYFYSKIDKSTLKPIKFIRNVNEGNYKRYFETTFDYESNIAYSLIGNSKETTIPTQCSIDEYCIQDVISVLYQLRAINFKQFNKGDNFELDIFMDNKIYDVNLYYNGFKKKKYIRNLGSFNTYMLIPETIAGNIFDEEDKMKIWVSADENKIPLMIESPISIGSIRAVLKSHKGLNTPLKKWNQ